MLYSFPCRNDLNIACAVHQIVFTSVSGSMVRYNVDNNPNGNIDGIQPTTNSTQFSNESYLAPIQEPNIHLAWNIERAFPVEDDVGHPVYKPSVSLH